jgi:hypothetical protein
MLYALIIHIIAFLIYSRRKDLVSLFGLAIIALIIGSIIPFGYLLSWLLMNAAEKKEGYEKKQDSFDKKFDEEL